MNIITTVERDNGTGVMSTEHTILTKIGGVYQALLQPDTDTSLYNIVI